MIFERTVRRVDRWLLEHGWSRLVPDRPPRVLPPGMESRFDYNQKTGRVYMGLDPKDAGYRGLAFQNRTYLYLHEVGHHFASLLFTREERRVFMPLFGDYDRHYRRKKNPSSNPRSFVSRYAQVHPADDFAETFATVVYSKMTERSLKQFVEDRGKNTTCRRKLSFLNRLLRSRRR